MLTLNTNHSIDSPMKIKRMLMLAGLLGLPFGTLAQSNWRKAVDSTQFNLNDTAKIARTVGGL